MPMLASKGWARIICSSSKSIVSLNWGIEPRPCRALWNVLT